MQFSIQSFSFYIPFRWFVKLSVIIFLFNNCKKAVTADSSKTTITGVEVFANDATANAAVRGIYSKMMAELTYANGDITLFSGLSSDELVNYSFASAQEEFFTNNLQTSNASLSKIWGQLYFSIYQANAILEGLNQSTGVSATLNKQLSAEAKFVRAFAYFYLMNYWNSVPLVLSTDYHINRQLGQSTANVILQQIIQDIQDAASDLPEYLTDNERTRPTKFAALALQARTHLFAGHWDQAESTATAIINDPAFQLESSLNNVFLKNSPEAIWQLQPVEAGLNTREGNMFIVSDFPQEAVLSESLLNAFETGDQRKTDWVGSVDAAGEIFYFPYKYKISYDDQVTEYYMVLRLAEQYLIRAEARARLNNVEGAVEDINAIRNRAGLSSTTATDLPALLSVLEHERRIEFFAEWGHRWLDLKRLNVADAVLSLEKGPDWQAEDVFYPIPQIEIQNNPNMIQNPGYH